MDLTTEIYKFYFVQNWRQ